MQGRRVRWLSGDDEPVTGTIIEDLGDVWTVEYGQARRVQFRAWDARLTVEEE